MEELEKAIEHLPEGKQIVCRQLAAGEYKKIFRWSVPGYYNRILKAMKAAGLYKPEMDQVLLDIIDSC